MRDLREFVIRGALVGKRPDNQLPDSPNSPLWEAWMDYVYLRDNPMGRHRELWFHSHGCRSWLVVDRDTVSHEICEIALCRHDATEGVRHE